MTKAETKERKPKMAKTGRDGGLTCPKCGVGGFDAQGLGPHVADCTGDPERTLALQRRRHRYKIKAAGDLDTDAAKAQRAEEYKRTTRVDLTTLTWDELVELGPARRRELEIRYRDAVARGKE